VQKQVLTVLAASPVPLSVPQIAHRLGRREPLHHAAVYGAVTRLTELGVLEKNRGRYALARAAGIP
jgi:DNA-binding IclR family transcriptional regulator